MTTETKAAWVAAPAISRRGAETATLAALLLLAAGLRLLPVLVSPSLNWADEIFQSTEQAHRLVYGTGLIPWEFQLGVRSWIFPGVVAALMEAARLLGDGPDYYLPVIATTFAALATAPVLCCYLWCRRSFGIAGAIVGGLAVAVAPELVYFGARTLIGVVAAHLLVIALYILDPGYRIASRRRAFLGGFLLGLLFVLRIQLAPILALAGLCAMIRLPRDGLRALTAGAALALFAAALFDWATLGAPLASLWRYLDYNVFDGVSVIFGSEPWSYYLGGEIGLWHGAALVLAALVLLGARRFPMLLVYALAEAVALSAIAHKEYRFIYPVIVLFAVLAGLGLAQLAAWGRGWLRGKGMAPRPALCLAAGLVPAFWCALAATIWTGPTMTALRRRDHDHLAAMSFVRREPRLCGVGLYGLDGKDWAWSGGYTYLHRNVPIYWPKDAREFAATAAGFNVLIYTKAPPAGAGFARRRCFGSVCVAERAKGCAPIPMLPMPYPKPIARLRPADGG